MFAAWNPAFFGVGGKGIEGRIASVGDIWTCERNYSGKASDDTRLRVDGDRGHSAEKHDVTRPEEAETQAFGGSNARLNSTNFALVPFRRVTPGKCLCSASSNRLRLGLGDQNSREKRILHFPKCHFTSLTHCHGGPRRVGLIFSSLPTQ